MKKSVKLGALAATALLAACATGSGAKGPDVTADQKDTGYVTSRDGGVVTGKFGECFHDKGFKATWKRLFYKDGKVAKTEDYSWTYAAGDKVTCSS